AELEMKLLIVNDETRQSGTVTIGLGMGEPATVESVRERIIKFRDKEMPKVAPGFRIATNREYWDSVCLEKFGSLMGVAGLSFGEDIDAGANGGFYDDIRHR